MYKEGENCMPLFFSIFALLMPFVNGMFLVFWPLKYVINTCNMLLGTYFLMFVLFLARYHNVLKGLKKIGKD